MAGCWSLVTAAAAPDPAEEPLLQTDVIGLRRTCLDGIGLPIPEVLQAWPASGARASAGPDRFLRPPEHGSHDAA